MSDRFVSPTSVKLVLGSQFSTLLERPFDLFLLVRTTGAQDVPNSTVYGLPEMVRSVAVANENKIPQPCNGL